MFNLFFLVFFAILMAAALAVLITRSSSPTKESFLLPEEDKAADPPGPPLKIADLERLVKHLCQTKGLKLKERHENSPDEVVWVAENEDPILYGILVFGCVEAAPPQGLTPLSAVLEFKDFVKGLGSTKGFLFTTGYFSRDVHQPLEGVKITLFNRKRVLAELAGAPSST
ncbi:MAG: hypothetical protein H6617_02785 [Bdellovibrionaceae bacterium]|nr:hypothetical protein [Bdellovibrionales bacterium]MCB9253588.1 hypothetical protein [Pseudobdellovibrionaceae bacterium]